MKNKMVVIIFIALFLLTSGCGAANLESVANKADSVNGSPPVAYTAGPASQVVDQSLNMESAEKKIIKNAEILLTVQNNLAAEAEVQELVAKYRGYIQNSESYKGKNSDYTNMEIRIPADSFEQFTSELADLGEITNNRVYTTDVTEEYIDLTARQKTLLLQEQRLQEMLKQTKNVDELLKVENELARVRGEIERITGRLRYLDNKISYSTVRLTLSTKYINNDNKIAGFGTDVIYSLKSGFNAFLTVLLFLIKAIVFLLPFWLIVLVVLFLIYKIKGKDFFHKK